MKNDNPDTFPEAEQTRWQETLADDVFMPTVRVQLYWRDVEAAVAQGAIVPQQAHALWASWAMPGSHTRLSSEAAGNGARGSDAAAAASSLESNWVDRPMPVVERRGGGSTWFGLLVGAALALIGVWAYGRL